MSEQSMSIVTCDRAECPRCDSLIASEHMGRVSLPPEANAWPRHNLLAWCDKCDTLWQATRVMQPYGGYEIEQVKEITDERIKRPFVRNIDRKHGALQVA